MYSDQPPIARVSTLELGLVSNRWLLSAVDMSKPVSMSTSASFYLRTGFGYHLVFWLYYDMLVLMSHVVGMVYVLVMSSNN